MQVLAFVLIHHYHISKVMHVPPNPALQLKSTIHVGLNGKEKIVLSRHSKAEPLGTVISSNSMFIQRQPRTYTSALSRLDLLAFRLS
jgi:hypothetical protein